MTSTHKSLTFIAYALPVGSTTLLLAPIAHLQGIYAKYFGVSLGVLAAIVLAGRIVDAAADLMVGFLSDRHAQKKGGRLPFVLAGGVLTVVAGYLLYTPPIQPGAIYFGVTFIGFYLAWTVFEIPHLATGNDIAKTSADKSFLFSARAVIAFLGTAVFYALPLLPMFETQEVTPETLRVSALVALAMMAPLLLAFYLSCKTAGGRSLRAGSARSVFSATAVRATVRSVRHNPPLALFLGAFVLITLGSGMWFGLIFLYINVFLNASDVFARIFLASSLVSIVSAPVWYWLLKRYEKKTTWLIAIGLMGVALLATGLLNPVFLPIGLLAAVPIVTKVALFGVNIVAPAMLSEIIDYSRLKHRVDVGGTYFGLFTLSTKVIMAVAFAAGLAIAGLFGFDPEAASQSASGEAGIRLAVSWIPAVMASIAVWVVVKYPLDAKKHAVIARRLDRLDRRAARDAMTQAGTAGAGTHPGAEDGAALSSPGGGR